VVGIVDDEVAGMAYFRRAALTPIHDDDAVHVSHLHVRRAFRRRGVTKALLGEAALWSEEKDSRHVMVTAASRSRDFHRFLARLGLTRWPSSVGRRLPACACGSPQRRRARNVRPSS
jgi:GNAT superfamily N-acetyltransferase